MKHTSKMNSKIVLLQVQRSLLAPASSKQQKQETANHGQLYTKDGENGYQNGKNIECPYDCYAHSRVKMV